MSIVSPSISMVPEVGGSIIVSMRASVDFPQPDSPTTASVEPRSTSKLTPLTACSSLVLPNMPPLIT
jgi:hypothetical protein